LTAAQDESKTKANLTLAGFAVGEGVKVYFDNREITSAVTTVEGNPNFVIGSAGT
jgi:hypothetical protein